MIRALASLWLTLGTLAALIGWFWLGASLANSASLAPAFRALNQELLLEWLARSAPAHPMVLAWLAGLLLLTGLLASNLIACILLRLVPAGNGRTLRRWLALGLHLLMLTVILAHGASFLVGYKRTGLRLLPGQSAELDQGLQLRLDRVSYASDPALLSLERRAAQRRMTRAAFIPEQNYVRLSLWRDGKKLAQGPAHILSPLAQGSLRVHVVGFFLSRERQGPPIGAMLNVVQSPLWPLFRVSYALLLASFLALTLLAARGGGRNKPADKGVDG